MSSTTRVTRVREAILTYLRQHPEAADTEQGIACWWLPEGLRGDQASVALALEALVREGQVSRQVNRDHHALYSSPTRRPPR